MKKQLKDPVTNSLANWLMIPLCIMLCAYPLYGQTSGSKNREQVAQITALDKNWQVTAFDTFDDPDNQEAYNANPLIYDPGAQAALGVTARLIDQYLRHALTSLRLIAGSPATRSGIWPEIRPALQTLCSTIPGAALYIESDGGYYSVERGYTGLNLSDREYFGKLFNGQEIHGELIYSRSTGKQSVIIAVPVFEGNEVTGAVALSVFLEDMQKLISESLNLPPSFLWYVINEEAYTVLHPRADFVFMNPAQQGGPSLSDAVELITTRQQGYTSYVFAGRNTHILFTSIPFNNWRVILGKIGDPVEDDISPEAVEVLERFKSSLNAQLREMDMNLSQAVAGFGGRFPSENIVRSAFRKIYENNPFVISCALVNTEGVMVYLEPAEFYPSQGKNIRDQENFYQMQKNKKPMLSNSFLALEGFDAVSLQHPIIDQMGRLHGSVSLLIRPEVMVEELATPFVVETPFEPWIMEPDGRIIFDKAFDGTGRMLFLDYRSMDTQSLLELGNQIANKRSGKGDFVYIHPHTEERTIKMAVWDTVRLHDAEWRVIISYTPYDEDEE